MSLCLSIYIYIHTHIYIYIYYLSLSIYIYIYRERDRYSTGGRRAAAWRRGAIAAAILVRRPCRRAQHICIYIYIYLYVYIYIYIYIHMYVHVHVHVHVYVYDYMIRCMCMCMCRCAWIYTVYVCIRTSCRQDLPWPGTCAHHHTPSWILTYTSCVYVIVAMCWQTTWLSHCDILNYALESCLYRWVGMDSNPCESNNLQVLKLHTCKYNGLSCSLPASARRYL